MHMGPCQGLPAQVPNVWRTCEHRCGLCAAPASADCGNRGRLCGAAIDARSAARRYPCLLVLAAYHTSCISARACGHVAVGCMASFTQLVPRVRKLPPASLERGMPLHRFPVPLRCPPADGSVYTCCTALSRTVHVPRAVRDEPTAKPQDLRQGSKQQLFLLYMRVRNTRRVTTNKKPVTRAHAQRYQAIRAPVPYNTGANVTPGRHFLCNIPLLNCCFRY